jgi:ActR/RegA family two-component response regulator
VPEPPFEALRGRRLLIVEDEYMIAADLAYTLEDRGVEVVGPVGSVDEALALVEAEGRLDGAVLDLNLGNDRAYPVADALLARGVPFVFATGYGREVIPAAYAEVPRCEKPIEMSALAKLLASRMKC